MRILGHTFLTAFAAAFVLSAALSQSLHAAQPQYQQDSQNEAGGPDSGAAARRIFELANQARAQAGVGRMAWDPALAAAAMAHCKRMVQEGPIAHRYGGEADLGARAAQAGAHFSLVEENVAVGPSAAGVHDEWMHSPGHRENLLNPLVNRVGIAVVAARGVLYAVADYSRGVESLTPAQVEASVAALIRPTGVEVMPDPAEARRACATDSGAPTGGEQPRFIMRWQTGDLDQLPTPLEQKLRSGEYRQAAVGSCPARDVEGAFTAYRLAVLLY